MSTVRFTTVIGQDKIIHAPADVDLPTGRAEVVVHQQEAGPGSDDDSIQAMVARLATAAEELGIENMPTDMAANHDHYAHGAPKGIDDR